MLDASGPVCTVNPEHGGHMAPVSVGWVGGTKQTTLDCPERVQGEGGLDKIVPTPLTQTPSY
jgi:hypothetical protein